MGQLTRPTCQPAPEQKTPYSRRLTSFKHYYTHTWVVFKSSLPHSRRAPSLVVGTSTSSGEGLEGGCFLTQDLTRRWCFLIPRHTHCPPSSTNTQPSLHLPPVPGSPPLSQFENKHRHGIWWNEQADTHNPRQCETSSVGQSAGLIIPRSSVPFRQKLQKPRTQLCMDLNYIDPETRALSYCYK